MIRAKDVLATLALAAVFFSAAGVHSQPRPERAEGWIKRSLTYVQQDEELATSEQQWQGSVIGRVGLGPDVDLVLRADTRPQSAQFTNLADLQLWQSAEVLGGLTWTALRRDTWELAPAVVGGVALDLSGDVDETPAIALGGAALRFGQAYLYLGAGVHQATNGNDLAVLGTLHVPLGIRQLAIDVDLVSGQARRVIVSVSARVFGWGAK